MAKEAFEKLVACLEQQLVRYEELAGLAGRMTEAIVQRQLEEIRALTSRQQHIAMELGRLEKTRMDAIKVLSGHFSISPEIATVSLLADRLAGEKGNKLRILAEALGETAKRLATLNQENRVLLEMSIEFVDFSLSVISGAGVHETRYDQRGMDLETPAKVPSKVFDFKA